MLASRLTRRPDPDHEDLLEQRVLLATVAREPRRLDRQHDADASLTDREQQPLQPWTSTAAAGSAEVVVHHYRFGPSQPAGTVRESILPPPALVVVAQLVARRLPDIDEGVFG